MPTSRAEARPEVTSPEPSPDSCPAATAAAGHREGPLVESTSQPGTNDFIPFAGDEGNDLDPERGDGFLRRPRDRPADEGLDAQLGQASPRPARRARSARREQLVRLEHDPAGFGFDDVQLPRRVEEGRDPAVPAGEGRLRAGVCSVSIHAGSGASVAPGGSEPRRCRRTRVRRTGCVKECAVSYAWRSGVTATPSETCGSASATPLRPEPTGRPAGEARSRVCGSAGRASSCGCRAPSPPRGG